MTRAHIGICGVAVIGCIIAAVGMTSATAPALVGLYGALGTISLAVFAWALGEDE